MNFGVWNETNLRVFKIPDVSLKDMVLHVKLKIMRLLQTAETDRLELLYCGNIMENGKTISTYVKDSNSMIFVIRKRLPIVETKHTEHNFDQILADYTEMYATPGFKDTILNAVKPEIMKTLVTVIPEISNDSVAQSIIKDTHLLEVILPPNIMKTQIEKHPAILLALDYLLKNILKDSIFPYQLTDEDFTEADEIGIRYTEQFLNLPSNSAQDPITVSQLAAALQNANRNNHTSENEDLDMLQLPLIANDVFGNALRDVLNDRNNEENAPGPINILSRNSLTWQLRQMHELGLSNDLLNFRALEVAGGDVQGAVELIMNGIID